MLTNGNTKLSFLTSLVCDNVVITQKTLSNIINSSQCLALPSSRFLRYSYDTFTKKSAYEDQYTTNSVSLHFASHLIAFAFIFTDYQVWLTTDHCERFEKSGLKLPGDGEYC